MSETPESWFPRTLHSSAPFRFAGPHGASGEPPPVYTSAGIKATAPSPVSQPAISGRRTKPQNLSASRRQPPKTLRSPSFVFSDEGEEYLDYETMKELFYEQGRRFLRELKRERRALKARARAELLHLQSEPLSSSAVHPSMACDEFDDEFLCAVESVDKDLNFETPTAADSGTQFKSTQLSPVFRCLRCRGFGHLEFECTTPSDYVIEDEELEPKPLPSECDKNPRAACFYVPLANSEVVSSSISHNSAPTIDEIDRIKQTGPANLDLESSGQNSNLALVCDQAETNTEVSPEILRCLVCHNVKLGYVEHGPTCFLSEPVSERVSGIEMEIRLLLYDASRYGIYLTENGNCCVDKMLGIGSLFAKLFRAENVLGTLTEIYGSLAELNLKFSRAYSSLAVPSVISWVLGKDMGLRLLLYDLCKNSKDRVQYRVDMITFDENLQRLDLCTLQPGRDDSGGVQSLLDNHSLSEASVLTSVVLELVKIGVLGPVSPGFEPSNRAQSFPPTHSSIESFYKVKHVFSLNFVHNKFSLSLALYELVKSCVEWDKVEFCWIAYEYSSLPECMLIERSICFDKVELIFSLPLHFDDKNLIIYFESCNYLVKVSIRFTWEFPEFVFRYDFRFSKFEFRLLLYEVCKSCICEFPGGLPCECVPCFDKLAKSTRNLAFNSVGGCLKLPESSHDDNLSKTVLTGLSSFLFAIRFAPTSLGFGFSGQISSFPSIGNSLKACKEVKYDFLLDIARGNSKLCCDEYCLNRALLSENSKEFMRGNIKFKELLPGCPCFVGFSPKNLTGNCGLLTELISVFIFAVFALDQVRFTHCPYNSDPGSRISPKPHFEYFVGADLIVWAAPCDLSKSGEVYCYNCRPVGIGLFLLLYDCLMKMGTGSP